MLPRFSFPRGGERSAAERGRSNVRDLTCFDSLGHFLTCFPVVQYLNALPVPMLRQVYFEVFLGVFFWCVFWGAFLVPKGSPKGPQKDPKSMKKMYRKGI